MPIDIRGWIYVSWVCFFLIWMIWGITAKRAVRRQSARSRLVQAALLVPAFWMLVTPAFRVGPLGWRILQHSAVTAYAAVLLTAIGFGIAIWARLHLGGNWSANVTVKQDHRLVQSGPYAIVRHPIYTGMSVAALGLVILNGDLRSFLAIALMVVGWREKFTLEEAFMTEQFGEEYRKYRRQVKALIPFLW